MVDEKTIKEALALLKVTYPNALKELTEEEAKLMINIWERDFQNTQKEIFLKAINNHRYTSKYFPSVAEIKEEIGKYQIDNQNIAKAEDEWLEVLNAVHKYGSYQEEKALDNLKEYTAYIVRHIGYMNICMSNDQTWNKKEFIEEYNSMLDKYQEILQISSSEKTLEEIMLGSSIYKRIGDGQ